MGIALLVKLQLNAPVSLDFLRKDPRCTKVLALVGGSLGLLGVTEHCAKLYHYNAIDDAYISFQYARQFFSGNGLVFNVGERVEGYTNFLWIVLIAPFLWTF